MVLVCYKPQTCIELYKPTAHNFELAIVLPLFHTGPRDILPLTGAPHDHLGFDHRFVGSDHGTGHFAPSGSIPRLAVVDSIVLGVDQRMAKSRQPSNAVSDRKTAPPQLCRLPA